MKQPIESRWIIFSFINLILFVSSGIAFLFNLFGILTGYHTIWVIPIASWYFIPITLLLATTCAMLTQALATKLQLFKKQNRPYLYFASAQTLILSLVLVEDFISQQTYPGLLHLREMDIRLLSQFAMILSNGVCTLFLVGVFIVKIIKVYRMQVNSPDDFLYYFNEMLLLPDPPESYQTYHTAWELLIEYLGGATTLRFSEVNASFLKKIKTWMRTKNITEENIQLYCSCYGDVFLYAKNRSS